MLMFHCLRSLTTLLFQMTKRHLRLLFIIIVFSAFITLQASAITDPRDGVWFMHCHPEVPYQLGLKMGWAVMDGKRPNQKLPPPPSDLPKC